MKIETINARLAAVDAEREESAAAVREAMARSKDIHDRRETLVTKKVNTVTDDQILADPDLRRWLCREADLNGAANDRVRNLMKLYGGQFYDNSWDGRDEYMGQWLPVPNLMMLRGSDTRGTADAIRKIADVWSLGRDTLPLDVFEKSLSAYGSYEGMYDPATDTAVLTRTTYGRTTEIASGTLDEVLTIVARDHYYRDPARENEYGDRIDDEDDDWER